MSKTNHKDILILLGLGILCYIIFFRHLGEFTIRLWDEGRNAVNAIEMLKNKNFLVTYFNNQPDMWNVKPPLHIWIVAVFFKIFGVNEFSLRLPSAISATLVVLIIYIFSSKILKNRWIGLLGSLIILSSMGFPDIHIGRTGDYDALLTLWVFLGSIFTFLYFRKFEKKYIYYAGIFWTLSILTKSVAGLLMIPGIILFAILDKKIISLFRQISFWKTVLIAVFGIAVYYVGREMINHGYLTAVLNEDLLGRYQKDIGSGGSSFWYYWNLFASFRFQKWIYFVPISMISYFLTKDKTLKSFILFSYILVVSYFVIISKSETKQFWYDAQLFPFMSLLTAIFIVLFIGKLQVLLRLFPILILCFYMQRYIRTNIAYIHRPDLDKSNSCIQYGYLFRDQSINKNGFTGFHNDLWCSPIQFYLEKNNLERKTLEEIKPDDKILSCDGPSINLLKEKYKTEQIFDNRNGCLGLKIITTTRLNGVNQIRWKK